MKKAIATLMLALFMILPVVPLTYSSASAINLFGNTCDKYQNGNTPGGSRPKVCNDIDKQRGSDENPIIRIIKTAVNIISLLAGAAAIITLVVGGIRLITSRGDSNAAASARSGIVAALIGVAIIALAQFLVNLVAEIL
jgi:hypothetical protein